MSDTKKSHHSGPKPAGYHATGPGGESVAFHSDPKLVGAWMTIGGPGATGEAPTLSVQSSRQGGTLMRYAGYRDGICRKADRLAISVDEAGAVSLQVVVPGDEVEEVYSIPLRELQELVRPLPHSVI